MFLDFLFLDIFFLTLLSFEGVCVAFHLSKLSLFSLSLTSRVQFTHTHAHAWKSVLSVFCRDVTLISEVVSLRSIRSGRAH